MFRILIVCFRLFESPVLKTLTDWNWPLCKALHNGHYVKFPFMYSDVAASEMRSGLETSISLTNFT